MIQSNLRIVVQLACDGDAHVLQGALVANFPWDANERGEHGYAATPDDATFRCEESNTQSSQP